MLTVLALLIPPAHACGGLFHSESELVESNVQEAIFKVNGDDTVTASYRVDYQGTAATFGWVIPIPSDFVSLVDGTDDEFTTMEDLTAPLVTWDASSSDSGSSGCGCLGYGGDKAGGIGDTAFGGVDIVAEGFAGPYSYTVLAATDSAPLLGWLSDNGWDVGDSTPIINEYVADGGFQFVAISLTPTTAAAPEQGRELPPVDITYAGQEVLYPARMGQTSMLDQLRTTIWVQGYHQYTLTSGWTETTLDPITGTGSDDPVALFDDALNTVAGDKAVYARTWSGSDASVNWITRFDTLAGREVQTADAVFDLATTDEPTTTTITLTGGDAPDTALLVPLGFLGYGMLRRRKLNLQS